MSGRSRDISKTGGANSEEARIQNMTDLERLGLGLIGFAVAVVVAGVLLGLIAAWINKNRGHRD
jgi:hypothetical protein